MAHLHSKEFAYSNIFARTRTTRRDRVNKVIDELMNHDYLVRKRPLLLKEHKTSYLSVFSYIDPEYAPGEIDFVFKKGKK